MNRVPNVVRAVLIGVATISCVILMAVATVLLADTMSTARVSCLK